MDAVYLAQATENMDRIASDAHMFLSPTVLDMLGSSTARIDVSH
jgi:hypothetical protein